MPWKKDDSGNLAVDGNGNPIFVQDGDNKETPVNYEAITKALSEASKGEANYRKKFSELERKFKPLEAVEDVAAYARAYQDLEEQNRRLIENSDAKQIEERVQAAKASIEKAWQDKEKSWNAQLDAQKSLIAQANEKVAALTEQTHREKIRGMFNESAYIKDKCALAPSILFELFSGKAKVNEEGNFAGLDPSTNEVALGTDGKPISFDAWIFKAIEAHPNGKELLKGSPHSGAGGNPLDGKPGGSNPWAKETYNVTEQHALYGKNPELAKQMAKAAGVNLGI
jgi:hypothetical protein